MIRFAAALLLEIIFFATLNFFDDWTLQGMPIKFVGAAFLSGAAYLAAVSNFKIDVSPAKQAIMFWGVAIFLRLLALPLVPADDLIRNQWEGKIQSANARSVMPTRNLNSNCAPGGSIAGHGSHSDCAKHALRLVYSLELVRPNYPVLAFK